MLLLLLRGEQTTRQFYFIITFSKAFVEDFFFENVKCKYSSKKKKKFTPLLTD